MELKFHDAALEFVAGARTKSGNTMKRNRMRPPRIRARIRMRAHHGIARTRIKSENSSRRFESMVGVARNKMTRDDYDAFASAAEVAIAEMARQACLPVATCELH